MELEDLAPWAEAFAAFCAHFDDEFVRSESRQQMRKYVRGLVAPLERKTSWQLAELVQDRTPDRMQRLLYRVPWDAEAVRHARLSLCGRGLLVDCVACIRTLQPSVL